MPADAGGSVPTWVLPVTPARSNTQAWLFQKGIKSTVLNYYNVIASNISICIIYLRVVNPYLDQKEQFQKIQSVFIIRFMF